MPAQWLDMPPDGTPLRQDQEDWDVMEISRYLLAGEFPEAFDSAQALLQQVTVGSNASQKVPVQLSDLAREGISHTSFALLGLRHSERIAPENPQSFDRSVAHVQTLIKTGSATVSRTALAYYLVILIRYFGEIVPEGSTETFTLEMVRKAAAISEDFQTALESNAGGGVGSTPHVQVCPHCDTKVLPSPDGICPNCRKSLANASAAATNASANSTPTMTAEIPPAKKPWWKVW